MKLRRTGNPGVSSKEKRKISEKAAKANLTGIKGIKGIIIYSLKCVKSRLNAKDAKFTTKSWGKNGSFKSGKSGFTAEDAVRPA